MVLSSTCMQSIAKLHAYLKLQLNPTFRVLKYGGKSNAGSTSLLWHHTVYTCREDNVPHLADVSQYLKGKLLAIKEHVTLTMSDI